MKPKKEKELNFNITENIAFKFMYIGKNYDGLVIQTSTNNTIEEIIFKALKKCKFLPDEKNIDKLMSISNFSRCGRTDKGVNSSGNVFSLYLRYDPKYNYVKALNCILPNDIIILSSCIVDDTFDARFSCLYREYKYYFIKKNMNINLMKKAALLLNGVHNFKNFCKIDRSDEKWETKNYERRIFDIKIESMNGNFIYPFYIKNNIINNEYYQPYVCIIKGSAFLWHQVRCIMQILFLIGEGLEDVELINEMLNENSIYNFNYGLADDANLVLSDCVFEFVNFKNDNKNCDAYYKMEKIYQDNLLQNVINSHFFNVIFNNSFSCNLGNKNKYDDAFKIVNESRRKQKYTKLLQIKTNRNKDKSNKRIEKK